jgi:pilus assembly protein Flp/PilA
MFTRIRQRINQFLQNQEGATAIEYAVMASLIAVAVIASVGLVASRTRDTFNTAGAAINPVIGGGP